MKINIYIIFAFFTMLSKSVCAQLNPMASVYYQNQAQANPALVGTEKGFVLSGALKAQWTAIDNAPMMQYLMANYGTNNERVGLGLNLYNESAGVFRRTSVKASYAYHIPLNDQNNFLDFGLAMGLMDEYIDLNKVRGDIDDISLARFNQRKTYLDGDFGFALRTEKLTVQGAINNLKRYLKRDVIRNVADRSLFMAAVSYNFINDDESLFSGGR